MTINDHMTKKHNKKSDSVLVKSLFSITQSSQQGFEKYFSLTSEPASLNIF